MKKWISSVKQILKQTKIYKDWQRKLSSVHNFSFFFLFLASLFILYLYNGNISTLAFFIFLFFFVSTITSPCFSRLYEIAGCLAGCVHIDCIYIRGIGVNSWIHVWNGNEAEQQQNIYMEENSLLGIPNSSETRWRKTTTSEKVVHENVYES